MIDPASASPVREGDFVAGKYRVERVLGMGGMGVVVAAVHVELEQRVALKFLLPAGAADPTLAKRFLREARAAVKIQSEHVARVIDVGTLASGAPFIVMEYMDGEDLEKVLRRDGPLPVDVVAKHILQALEAIAEAHALGIVHRDLKPANLFLARRPSGAAIIKVSDFGISKLGSSSDVGLTNTSTLLGSPAYMAPEQMTAAKDVDARVDIWALGVVLHELIAGRRPFMAETLPELIVNILHHPPSALGRADVPPGLDHAIRVCLEKDPANRYQNVAQLAAAIAPFSAARSAGSIDRISHVLGVSAALPLAMAATIPAHGSSPSAYPCSADQEQLASAGVGTNGSWAGSLAGAVTGKAPRGPSKALRVLGLALVMGVLLGVGGGVMWLRGHAAPDAVPSSSAMLAAAPVASPAAPTVASADPWVESASGIASAAAGAATSDVHANVADPKPPVLPHPAATPPRPAAPSPPARPPEPPPVVPVVPLESAKPGAPSCHIVSTVESDGTERFKKVCN